MGKRSNVPRGSPPLPGRARATLPLLDSALIDIVGGIERWRVWVALASEELTDQHRRTTLGPIWLLINYLAFAGAFIFVFHPGPFDRPYAMYVATGSWIWFYVMEVVTQGTSVFVREEGLIKGTTLPLSVYVMRATLQSVIRAGYALLGCIVILLAVHAEIEPIWLASVFGIGLVVALTPAVLIVLAFLGVYLPDSQYVIVNVMRVAMFVTPVFWQLQKGETGLRGGLSVWNPFTYVLEVVRVPIVSGDVPVTALSVCGALVVLFWVAAIVLLGTLRRDVALAL